MKRTSSKTNPNHQKSDSLSFEKETQNNKSFQGKSINISPLSLNTLTSNATTYMDTGLDTSSQKHYKGPSSATNYENQYFKLSNGIREIFSEIKNRTLKDDPNCALMLKKAVPFDQSSDSLNNTDALVLLQYIKKIYDKTMEFKNEAEVELSAKKDSECNDYEGMLQKLEAEVRQHIRIEQQLKLYVESTQSKLDDLEKSYDPAKIEAIQKENESLKNETCTLSEKLKKREHDLESYKKELHNKNSLIKDLEHQVENLPALKSKIRDLEKMVGAGGARPPSSNILKGSNRSNRDENAEKNNSFSNQFYAGEKGRKGSHPSVGLPGYEISKQKQYDKERDKENLETYKLDLSSKNMYESAKGYRSTSQNEVQKNDNPRGSIRKEEKSEDFSSVLERMKNSLKSSNSRNTSKENLRASDQTINPDELLDHNNSRTYDSKKIKRDSLDTSKTYDKKILSTSYSRENEKKSWGGQEYKQDSKPASNKLAYHKDGYDMDTHSNPRNNIPRPGRPSTGGYQEANSYIDYSKYKRESEAYDLNKLKVSSPKKINPDRSQSVKLGRQVKSKEDVNDKPVGEEDRSSMGSYNNVYVNNYNQSRANNSMIRSGHH